MKKLLHSLTRKDFRWDYYRGHGAGGQKKNKTENCCRCTHEQSGAVGKSEKGRSKEQNRKRAFVRMAESKKFTDWLKIDTARRLGNLDGVEKWVEESMKNIKVEVKAGGKWIEEKSNG